MNNSESEPQIPQIELTDFQFSPPGSMGWSQADYEEILRHPEKDIQTTPTDLPGVPTTDLHELLPVVGFTPEQVIDAKQINKPEQQNATGEMRQSQPDAYKAVPTATKTKHGEQEKAQPPNDGYILSTQPPAKPWLVSFI